MEQTQLLWPYGKRPATLDRALCAEELELAALSATLLPGLHGEEALETLWPLLTRHLPTLESRAALTYALTEDPELLGLLETCAEDLKKLVRLWAEYQECAAVAASSRTAAGLIGFVRGFEKITGRNTGGVIESDTQSRDYYSCLFRSAYLGLRAAALYFGTLNRLCKYTGPIPDPLQPLFSEAKRCWQQDRGEHAAQLLEKLQQEYPEPAAFAVEIGYSREMRPATLTVSEVRASGYHRESILGSSAWDGLSSALRFPQLASSESFRSLLLAELGMTQRSRLIKLQKELSALSLSGVEHLGAFGEELHFFTTAARFGRKLQEAGMPVCQPVYRESEPLAELRGLYPATPALFSGKQVQSDALLDNNNLFAVITGANGSGKTAYLISLGQCVWLSMLGYPLPAERAMVSPPDQICCLFAAGESETGEDSRMGIETARLAEIERIATSASLVLMNEPLTSTSASEAIEICSEVISGFCKSGVKGMMVTHYSEIYDAAKETLCEIDPTLGESLRSLVAKSEPGPEGIVHTYRVEEAPPVRTSYAAGVANALGVTLRAMLQTLRSHGVELPPMTEEVD